MNMFYFVKDKKTNKENKSNNILYFEKMKEKSQVISSFYAMSFFFCLIFKYFYIKQPYILEVRK